VHLPVQQVVAQVREAGYGRDDFYSVIERGDEPGVSASTGAAGHAQAVAIDFRSGHQVIQRPEGVPGLNSGRGVAPSVPPPLCLGISALVAPADFSPLQGVEHEADITIAGKPNPMMLISGLVAEA